MEVAPLTSSPLITSAPIKKKEAGGVKTGDSFASASISLSRELNNYGIDLPNARIELQNAGNSYNFSFSGKTELSYSINGYTAADFSEGKIDLSFSFSLKAGSGKNEELRQYRGELQISFKSLHSYSETKKEKKEEVLDFLMRIVREVMTKINREGKNISAVVFDPEDLKELAQISDGKVRKLLLNLIEMIRMVIEAKKLAAKNSKTESEIYSPRREVTKYIEKVETREINLDYSLSIRESSGPNTTQNKQ